MKSIFTLLLAALFTFTAVAQDLTLSEENMVIDASGGFELGDLTLTNNSNATIEIAVRLERVCLTSLDPTKIQICIGTLCFAAVNTTTTWGQDNATAFVTLEAGASDSQFSFHQLPYGDYESEWNIVFYDRNNEASAATLNIKIEDPTLEACTPTGTNDFDYTIGKAYPNPAFDLINISYEIDVNEANLNIYNSTGMLVETVVVNPQSESVAVNLADYVNGVYFYNVTDGKGQSKMMSFVK
ncbi:MAG: hypothetical protein ACI8YQ_003906 [Polaribacter sp.]|jgi:hypothetical protein